REFLDVHGVGNDRYLLRIDAARDDVRAQAFTDGSHSIGALQYVGFERASESIARRTLSRAAVVDRGVFPEGANFVDYRHAEPASHAQRWDRIQRRRVCVQQLRFDLLGNRLQTVRERVHHPQLRHRRQAGEPRAVERRAEEMPAVDRLFETLGALLLRAGEMGRVPSEPPLLSQYRQRAKRVAAVQWERVIEDMQDAHGTFRPPP